METLNSCLSKRYHSHSATLHVHVALARYINAVEYV